MIRKPKDDCPRDCSCHGSAKPCPACGRKRPTVIIKPLGKIGCSKAECR